MLRMALSALSAVLTMYIVQCQNCYREYTSRLMILQNVFTYLGGSTTGGAVVYENGKYLYSHHATDPCSGRLVNAFDLVRLHKFADKDDEASIGTPTNRLPSFSAMCEFACGINEVSALLSKERYDSAVKDLRV